MWRNNFGPPPAQLFLKSEVDLKTRFLQAFLHNVTRFISMNYFVISYNQILFHCFSFSFFILPLHQYCSLFVQYKRCLWVHPSSNAFLLKKTHQMGSSHRNPSPPHQSILFSNILICHSCKPKPNFGKNWCTGRKFMKYFTFGSIFS